MHLRFTRNGRLRIYEDNTFPFTVCEDNKSAFTVCENTPLAPSLIYPNFHIIVTFAGSVVIQMFVSRSTVLYWNSMNSFGLYQLNDIRMTFNPSEPADNDECLSGEHNCDFPLVCHNTHGGFTCNCTTGYTSEENTTVCTGTHTIMG